MIRAALLVDGKVTFKHAALRTKAINHVQVIIASGINYLVGRGWGATFVEPKTVQRHNDAAELSDNIFTFGKLSNINFPLCQYLVASAFMLANAKWASEMIDDNWLVGKRVCEVG